MTTRKDDLVLVCTRPPAEGCPHVHEVPAWADRVPKRCMVASCSRPFDPASERAVAKAGGR